MNNSVYCLEFNDDGVKEYKYFNSKEEAVKYMNVLRQNFPDCFSVQGLDE
jgi:hypothetical protein